MKQKMLQKKSPILEKKEEIIKSEVKKVSNASISNESFFDCNQNMKPTSEVDAKANLFFARVLSRYKVENPLEKIAFITVSHVVPTLPYFLDAVSKIGRVAGVIAKSASIDSRVEEEITQKYKLFIDHDNKEKFKNEFQNPQQAITFFKKIIDIKNGEQFIIIDIGGYFAQCLPQLANDKDIKNSLLGIVEDTENGHQKYGKIIEQTEFPVISVARSFLKETEDYNVGKSIVRAVDTILRTDVHTITELFQNIAVIGFGKIGRSIAEHVKQMGREPVICETSPKLQMLAKSKGFKLANMTTITPESDLIFSATGNKALIISKDTQLKNNVFISSVRACNKITSPF